MSKNSADYERAILSEKGQITIPKSIREELGLVPGTVLVFYPQSGKIIAEKDDQQAPLGKWRGKGKLPRGLSVNDYLKASRDADGR
jgi:AbrB family looped-hinge helix DNA binding protein